MLVKELKELYMFCTLQLVDHLMIAVEAIADQRGHNVIRER
jgi:hypothetical protein